MPSTDQVIRFEYCGIRVTDKSLSEIDSGRIMVIVDKQAIRNITLRYGFQAMHPAPQIIVGWALILLGYFPLLHFIHWAQHGGVFIDLEAWIIPFAAIGGWLVYSATKRGYFLEVGQDKGTKRLTFSGKPNPGDLGAFLTTIEQDYGLKIERTNVPA